MDVLYKKPSELTNKIRHAMFELMSTYYDNLTIDQFELDLENKEDVIIMVENSLIRGFTTIEHIRLDIEGESILGIFSGNTIMDLSIPPSLRLQQGFIRYIEKLKKSIKIPVYWFLICKGYKTYRYLNVYCKSYYPSYKEETPVFEKRIMDAYAIKKYPNHYNPLTGIIKHDDGMDYLKEDVAPVTDRILRKPEVAFFVEKNPQHVQGDELVCLASFSDENLKSGYFRALR